MEGLPEKVKILFLCTGNSCRSQMAEAWTRHLKADLIEPYSAGIEPKGVDPRAIKAMAEAGIDMSGQVSKDLASLQHLEFDYVITLCDNAHESCPFFPAKTRVLHIGFDDPPRLARDARTEEEALVHYRRVRDEIKKFIETLPAYLEGASNEA
ncbi:MAG: arsenate reductase ArsC [Syntrophobacteraceae bacterium]|jgi:arsenate reductase